MHVLTCEYGCETQGLAAITSNPVISTGIAGLATSATAQATIQVPCHVTRCHALPCHPDSGCSPLFCLPGLRDMCYAVVIVPTVRSI